MDTMTENDYFIAWGLYAFAALGCVLVWFRLTRWMWRWLREPLRVLMAVLLFSPTIVDPGKDQFAPAVAITALDILFKVANNAWRAVSDLAMYAVIAFALYFLFVLVRWPIERKAQARKAERDAIAERHAQEMAREQAEEDDPFLRQRSTGLQADDRPGRNRPSAAGDLRVEPRL